MDNFILCGMQFGDEGKGTFVDYLTHKENVQEIIKYNGGSQASHTVITPEGTLHKFSQLGSGMFSDSCHTFLDQNMVINLENLVTEMNVFCEKTGISFSELRDRIHIHEDCPIVTPYHKLANKLRELSLGNNRRGSVGTGVSEVMYLLSRSSFEHPLVLRVRDIYNYDSNSQVFAIFRNLQEYVSNFYDENKNAIWKNAPEDMKTPLKNEIDFLLKGAASFKLASRYIHDFKYALPEVSFRNCIYSYRRNYFLNLENTATIYEGSQGLLIDGVYGLKPNTTCLDTTNNFATCLCSYAKCVTHIGIAKAFSSRHGLGVFPTEDTEVNQKISDENQESTFWNGHIRFGWFDCVLLKYAQTINKVDKLYLSSLDKLDSFKKIKVCTSYVYTGIIDEKFKGIFEYTVNPDGIIIINSIKAPDSSLRKYLKNCCPVYMVVDGWMTDISKITNVSELPKKCLEYIHLLENLSGIPISVVSVGPTRNNKIQLEQKAEVLYESL